MFSSTPRMQNVYTEYLIPLSSTHFFSHKQLHIGIETPVHISPRGALNFGSEGVLGQQLETRGLLVTDFSPRRGSFSEKTKKRRSIFQTKYKFGHIFDKHFGKKMKTLTKRCKKRGSFSERLSNFCCKLLKKGYLVRAKQKRVH